MPPPEQEEFRAPRPVPVAQAQKHYKIIFIKAPSAPAYQAPIIPVAPQNEEKTLVYVLVKKPEEQPEIVIPTAAPTQPSKPEVYFIKYKTQKDNAGGGYAGGSAGGIGGIGGIGGGDIGSADLGSSGIGGGDFGASGHGSTGPSSSYGPPAKTGGPY